MKSGLGTYPAGFNPETLRHCFGVVHLDPGRLLVDPFAGASTVGTYAVAHGVRFAGIEAHPLIAELGELKFRSPPSSDPESALHAVSRPVDEVDVDAENELVRRCFSRDVLRQLVSARLRLEEGDGGDWEPWLSWALLATLRDVACVSVGWPYLRPDRARRPVYGDAIERLKQRFRAMVTDLDDHAIGRADGWTTTGDSRAPRAWTDALGGQQADGCISSPPYLNNFDYADATRLELFFLGRAATWKQMCNSFRGDMVIATTQQTSRDQHKQHSARFCEWPTAERDLLHVERQLATERAKRPRGKEYDAAFAGYFAGVGSVLANLSTHLKPDAKTALVIGDSAPYGIYVDTSPVRGRRGRTAATASLAATGSGLARTTR